MKFKIFLVSIFCFTLAVAENIPMSPAWKIRNNSNQPITANVFFNSQQPKLRNDEMPFGAKTIAPGKEESAGLEPNVDYFFYYKPSRLEVSAGSQKAIWTAPKAGYYNLDVNLKNNKLEIGSKNWSNSDIAQHENNIKHNYPKLPEYYEKDFKPRLNNALKK